MGSIESHRDLVVWQKAMDLAVIVYRLARRFPRSETYGLISQMTRAIASVPANIAEGSARGTRRDYAHFLAIAKGSLMEAETLLTLCEQIGWFPPQETQTLRQLLDEVSRMLTTLRRKFRAA